MSYSHLRPIRQRPPKAVAAAATLTLLAAGTLALGVTASIAAATPAGAMVSPLEPVPTLVVAKAEATGQAGVLMRYSPASGTWTEAAVVDQSLALAVTNPPVGVAVAEPDISPKAAFACLVLTWSIGACNDLMVPYKQLLGYDVVQEADVVDRDALGLGEESYDTWRLKMDILEGSNGEAGSSTTAGVGSSSDTANGAAVTFDDFGEDFVYVVEDDWWTFFF